jgi:CHAT domain-containing protein
MASDGLAAPPSPVVVSSRRRPSLDLTADVVTLSACETGLGRLVGGEGVVGLTQAFVEAGAGGVSVSLWQVADRSTSTLMQAVYERMETEGEAFDVALTTVKRAFIAGDYGEAYRAPYVWAPFVYYGRSPRR